jgi:hypothetical protein
MATGSHMQVAGELACAVPKGQTPLLSWAFAGRLGGSAVLADQPGDGSSMVDPAVMSITSLGSCVGGRRERPDVGGGR